MIKELATKASDIKQLVADIKAASDFYYNSGKFATIRGKKITDAVFDTMVDRLKELDPTNPQLKKIGAPIVKQKVKLPFFMGSLDKIKPETGAVSTWASRFPGPYIISDKADGVSILLVYEAGKPTKAYTRGNGTYGQDISYLVPHMKIPQKAGTMALRGEIIMPRAKFKAWADEFENARNMVSGLVTRKDVHQGVKDVHVVIYESLAPRGVPSKIFAGLKSKGFTVVPYKVVDALSDGVLSKMLEARKSNSKYDIDGLVVAQDKKTALTAGSNPANAVAFKMTSSDNVATVDVVQVVWEASKHSLLKPRIEIKPTKLNGVTITYCTGFNAKYIKDNKIGPGAVLSITRSGDVIPHILEVLKSTRAQMPKGNWDWNKSGVDAVLLDEDIGVEVKKINAFFRMLEVENMAEGIVAKLYDAGFDSIDKIIRMKVKDYLSVEGIQQRMAEKLYANMREACANAYMPYAAEGSGFFGRGFGYKRFEAVLEEYPDVFSLAKLNPKLLYSKVVAIKGFSDIMATQFVEGLRPFITWVNKLPIKWAEPEEVEVVSSKLKGQRICFTGFRDAALEEIIEANGGEVVGAVNSKTTILLLRDAASTSSKADAARNLGIKVMDAAKFKKAYRL